MGKLSKLQLKKIKEQEQETRWQSALKERKQMHKKPENILKAYRDGRIRAYDLPYGSGKERICQIFQSEISNTQIDNYRNDFFYLLKKLSDMRGVQLIEDAQIVDGLYALARFRNFWKRELKYWQPNTRNRSRQFSHLIRYLLADYEVPLFMDQAFYHDMDTHISWFIHIGEGGNIRKAQHLPIHLSKKMAHYFLQAPKEYSIRAALRYGQILGMGGNENLVKAILGSYIGGRFENEAFWETVIRFFVNHPPMDYTKINPIIDYIRHQKFESRQVTLGRGQVVRLEPPQPDFSIKGRTINALLRSVEQWHQELRRQNNRFKGITWVPVDIPDFQYVENENTMEEKVYRIEQLLTGDELALEGQAMYHCVAGYVQDCVSGGSTIWSLTVEDLFQGKQRMLTIELNKRKEVVQARGKYNDCPTNKGVEVLNKWACQHQVIIPKWMND